MANFFVSSPTIALAALAAENNVPGVDAVTNVKTRDVTGNKADSLIEAVGVNKSNIAYTKGLIQLLAQLGSPKMAYYEGTGTGYTSVVDITDKGILTGISVNKETSVLGATIVMLKVTLDAVQLYANKFIKQDLATIEGLVWSTQSLSFFHRFNTSLKIEIGNVAGAAWHYCTVSYTVDL